MGNCVQEVKGHDESLVPIPDGSGNQKTVAVTGANGFIGSHIVKELLAKGYKVRGTVQDLDPAKVDFLKYLPLAAENLSLFRGELLDEGCFDDVFEGCDCVFHLASPTLKDQREMKNPEEEMINQAVNGTLNVLTSCKYTGVKCVVLTSSMCAATPKPRMPEVIHEQHWADHEYLLKKGSYYAASKVLKEKAAVEFVSNMPKESVFRLVRILPSLTVGPMLQPTVNSSMDRFAAICRGIHHKKVPNRSISLIDVRDVAQHHIAAYEKGLEGRYLSTTEGLHWTTVYQLLKILRPQMKCPELLETEHRAVRKYDKTRMNAFGVKERSPHQTIEDAMKEVDSQKLDGCAYPCHNEGSAAFAEFVPYCGYYDLGKGDGRFFLIYVFANFAQNQYVKYSVNLYFVLTNTETPDGFELPTDNPSSYIKGDTFTWPDENIAVSFSPGTPGIGKFNISGSIKNVSIPYGSTGGGTAVPASLFGGTYTGDAGTVTIRISDIGSSITYEASKTESSNTESFKTASFTYIPLKRQFIYPDGEAKLYMNVEAGHGLMLTMVRSGTTKFFYLDRNVKQIPKGPVTGAADLATFAGFYTLDSPGSSPGSFVSIEGKTTTTAVGVCTDGINSTEYTSFKFEGNRLSFQGTDLSLDFSRTTEDFETASVTLVSSNLTGRNYFSVVPLAAFGKRTFYGTKISSGEACTLQIGQQGTLITYTVGDVKVINTSAFEYNPVVQNLAYGNRLLFFTYNGFKGATCAVTLIPPGIEAVLYVYEKTKKTVEEAN